MSDHCLFCGSSVVVYSNGLSGRIPGIGIHFGLCEEHAYTKYRTKSGRPLKYPQSNSVLMSLAWQWARRVLFWKELREAETFSPCLNYGLPELLEGGMELFQSEPFCPN